MKFLAILLCFASIQIVFGQPKFSVTVSSKDGNDWRSAVNGLFEPRRKFVLTGTGLDGKTTKIGTPEINDGLAIGNAATTVALNKQRLEPISGGSPGFFIGSTNGLRGSAGSLKGSSVVGGKGSVQSKGAGVSGGYGEGAFVGYGSDSVGAFSVGRKSLGGFKERGISSVSVGSYGSDFSKVGDSSESKEDVSGSREGKEGSAESGAGGKDSGRRVSGFTGLGGRVRNSSPEEEVSNGYGSVFKSVDFSKSLNTEINSGSDSGSGSSESSSYGSSAGWGDISRGPNSGDGRGSRVDQTGSNSIIRLLARFAFRGYAMGGYGVEVIEVLERILPTMNDIVSAMSDFRKMSNLLNDTKYRMIKEKDSFINGCVETMKALCNKKEMQLLYFLNGTSMIKKKHIVQLSDLLSDMCREAMETKEFVSLTENLKQRTTAPIINFNTRGDTWSRVVNHVKQFTEAVHNLLKRKDATINEWMHVYEDFLGKISIFQSDPHVSLFVKTAKATMYANETQIEINIEILKKNISDTLENYKHKLYKFTDACACLIGQNAWINITNTLINETIDSVRSEIMKNIDAILGPKGEGLIAFRDSLMSVTKDQKISKILGDHKNHLGYMLSDGFNSVLLRILVTLCLQIIN